MKQLLTFISLLTFATLTCAQESYYVDEDHAPCNKNEAVFIKTIQEYENGYKAIIHSKYSNDLLESYGLLSKSSYMRHGFYTSYYWNGPIREEGNYDNDKPVGEWVSYYNNKKHTVKSKRIYKNGVEYFTEYNSKDGDAFLENGTGYATQYDRDHGGNKTLMFVDSLLITGFYTNKKNSDTVYFLNITPPKFKGNPMEFFKNLQINYPEMASSAGLQGDVHLDLVIDESGKITDAHVIKAIGAGMDEEAVRAVKASTTEFIPGTFEGKAIKATFKVPIRFRLQY